MPTLKNALRAGHDVALVVTQPDRPVGRGQQMTPPPVKTTALEAGIHVMCEKPLALTLAGCDRIAAARDRSGRVVQVAYMKRYDPAYRRALGLLPARIEEVRLIAVEVNDPDHEPFVAHLPRALRRPRKRPRQGQLQ